MKMIKTVFLVTLVVMAFTLNIAQAQEHPGKSEHPTEHPTKRPTANSALDANNLIAVATTAGNFKTFLAAVETAHLTNKFQIDGPFTVFAPTDAAFAKLPKGTLEDLLKPANRAKLAGLLATHVVPGKIMVADIKTMKATNVNGQDLALKVNDSVVTINGATVVKADLTASNGVIHAIDTVIMTADRAATPVSTKPKDHPAH